VCTHVHACMCVYVCVCVCAHRAAGEQLVLQADLLQRSGGRVPAIRTQS